MATYKFTHTRSWTTSEEYWEEFDTEDQEKWDKLLGYLEEVNDFPKKAPKEPEIWFNLYSLLNETDLENQDGEFTGDTTEHEFALYDEEGRPIC
jgi:hypothetical protein